MYHSITIGTDLLNPLISDAHKVKKNTWDDWHLIPTSRPLVNPPSPSINRIAIPGGDGSLDVSEVMAGRPTYSDRSGSWSFYADNDFMPWSSLYSEIMRYLHGQKMQCVLEDDPRYYYEGRFSVNEWRSEAARSMITINYVLSPYKMFYIGLEDWVWDTLYFGDPSDPYDKGSSIRTYKNIKVFSRTNKLIEISGDFRGAVVNVYTNRPNCFVVFDGKTYPLSKYKYTELKGLELSSDRVNELRIRYDGVTLGLNNEDKEKYKLASFSIKIDGGIL